jgi:hypothetical protein
MSFTVDTTEEQLINIDPQTVYEEVIQNVWFLLSSVEYDIPLNRAFGLNATYIDKPIETAKALLTADLYDKIAEYEPRAEIVSIDFTVDYESGKLKPKVEVEVNGEYNDNDSEEYTE